MKFSLAISHTPWVPERAASFQRLLADLAPSPCTAHIFDEKEPNDVWSLKMWTWAAEQDAEWCIFLQDDALVSPDFWADLTRIVDHSPHGLIGLQAPHPAALPLAEEGYSGFMTTDGLVGVGYCVRRDVLPIFLGWRARNEKFLSGRVDKATGEEGRRGALTDKWPVTEDTMLGLYAAVAMVGVYHPIPTIVDHDTSIPSQYKNDGHENRRSVCRWDTPRPGVPFKPGTPHVGRFYHATPALLARYTDTPPGQIETIRRDTGNDEKRRIRYAQLGRGQKPAVKLFMATPTRGTVTPEYAQSMFRLLHQEAISADSHLEISRGLTITQDVVRVRNRLIHMFLEESDATHLLFVDDDVEFQASAVTGMIAADHGFVACPYPQRGGVNWGALEQEAANQQRQVPLESLAYRYHIRTKGDGEVKPEDIGADGCLEVDAVPLGMCLLRRAELRAAYDVCESRYIDRLPDGRQVQVANLCGLVIEGGLEGGLLSEDYSFCARWRKYGGRVMMYLGDGSPVTHHGSMGYRGMVEAFNLRRA